MAALMRACLQIQHGQGYVLLLCVLGPLNYLEKINYHDFQSCLICLNSSILQHGHGRCQAITLPNVKGCIIEYQYVEVLHAGIQILLGMIGMVLGGLLAYYYYTQLDAKRRQAKKSSHMYSIEYSPQVLVFTFFNVCWFDHCIYPL